MRHKNRKNNKCLYTLSLHIKTWSLHEKIPMEILPVKPKMHVFVCVNDRSAIPGNTTPSCGPKIKEEDVKELKLWIRAQGYTNDIYCTKTKCLGFCNAESPVICIWPQGKFLKVKDKEEIKKIILQEL